MPRRSFPFSLLPDDPHAAPASPSPSIATRRRAARRPDQPQPGEGFADYQRRIGPMAPPAAGPEPAPQAAALEEWRRLQAAQSMRTQRPLREVTREELRTSRDAERRHQWRALRGAFRGEIPYEGPTSMALIEIPVARNPIFNQPERGLGLIRWGVDGRRPFTDVARDVETVTGAPEGYLDIVGLRESDRGRRRGNAESSVRGAYHFLGSTYERFHAFAGARYGYHGVHPDDIANLREDDRAAGAMAAEYARDNWHRFKARLGFAPTRGELYAMHFGDENALRLLKDWHRHPERRATAAAASYFTPRQVSANEAVFFPQIGTDSDGRPIYDRSRPHSLDHFRRRMSDGFADGPAEFRPRLDGSTDYYGQSR